MLARVSEARLLLQHSGIYGSNNEGLLIEALRDYLGDEWKIGSGEIMDVHGNRSPQCDVIVYDGRVMPEAFRSASGNVVVFAHAVGAVIEVKSTIGSGCSISEKGAKGDIRKLFEQLDKIHSFLDAALKEGNSKIKDEASGAATAFGTKRIPIIGFSYQSLVLEDMFLKCVQEMSEEIKKVLHIFVLDLKRKSEDVIHEATSLNTSTASAVESFVDKMRMPNGKEFATHFGMSGSTVTWASWKTDHKEDCLRILVKTILDRARTESPLSVNPSLSKREWEKVYSCYNTWDDTYMSMESGV